MCGITGFWDTSGQISTDKMQWIVRQMSDTLLHRGPDDGGTWVDVEAGIALGHRRLSILDLSPEGHQPMQSASGRYVIVFNGEIYNFLELRQELESLGHHFRGHSDTEVMLASFSQWGLNQALGRFNGMFAFALWDRQERVLHLGRDRLGEKPLYYGCINQTFFFGSELKALKAHPKFQAEINRDALALFVRHNCIPAPYSIYQGIYKLPPGTVLTWKGDGNLTPVPYWSAKEVAERGVAKSFVGSESEAVARLEALLQEAVALRMVADVPLGAFLSGGIDSSTVVALMQSQSSQPVKTFSIGFYEEAYNEAKDAKAVAEHLGTDHTELYVTPEEAIAVIPKLPTLYDEPFSDSSQIPTFLVSQLAKQHVTVSLSGDGGDELFGGYNRYFWGRSIWGKIGWMPQHLRQVAASALTSLSPQTWNQLFTGFGAVLPPVLRQRNPGDKLHKLAEILAVDSPDTMYKGLVSHCKEPEYLVFGSLEPSTTLTDRKKWARLPDFTQRMMFLDTVTYLPDDILTKVDRASMGVSLEARVPLLDHRLVEFAWQLPLDMKIRNEQGKWLLRQVLYKYVPQKLIERPKMGFGIPIDDWLRGPLRDWAEALLDEKRLREEGFFDPQPIREQWTEHLSGERNWQYYLWDVLMFQAWLSEKLC
ncbi:MAG TPA: asparagine synthase (glutamine-hydrolyzing) [Cyanobacteria bacterium UBA8553]|nr:asparagine synthase (glutamine-hydrolyzing) [Cyanobacteria bacterium UBA8553]